MLFAICLQELAVVRSFPPLPESGEVPEDADTEAADSETTVEDEAEDEETDDANNFVIQPRTSSVEALSDTESSPAEHDIDADVEPLIHAAPPVSPTAAPKRSTGGFADEDALFDS